MGQVGQIHQLNINISANIRCVCGGIKCLISEDTCPSLSLRTLPAYPSFYFIRTSQCSQLVYILPPVSIQRLHSMIIAFLFLLKPPENILSLLFMPVTSAPSWIPLTLIFPSKDTYLGVCTTSEPSKIFLLPVYIKTTHYDSNYFQIMLIWISVLYKDSHAYLFVRL